MMCRLQDDLELLHDLVNSRLVQGTVLFLEGVAHWQKVLGTVDRFLAALADAQARWRRLRAVLAESPDARARWQDLSAAFDPLGERWAALARDLAARPAVLESCSDAAALDRAQALAADLEGCERALAGVLDAKRRACPRLYFLSDEELLRAAAAPGDPDRALRACAACFDGIAGLRLAQGPADGGVGTGEEEAHMAVGVVGTAGEFVAFNEALDCGGGVEVWLQHLTAHVQRAVAGAVQGAVTVCQDSPRQLLADFTHQVVCTVTRIAFAADVERILGAAGQDTEASLREFNESQRDLVQQAAERVAEQAGAADRNKVGAVVVLRLHGQEVVQRMVEEAPSSRHGFVWAMHLKLRFEPRSAACAASLAYFERALAHEYVGGAPSLVVTPLTDRCFLSLAQVRTPFRLLQVTPDLHLIYT
jgi:dynein heavy chain